MWCVVWWVVGGVGVGLLLLWMAARGGTAGWPRRLGRPGLAADCGGGGGAAAAAAVAAAKVAARVLAAVPGGGLAGGGVKTSVVTGGGSGPGLGPAAARAG